MSVITLAPLAHRSRAVAVVRHYIEQDYAAVPVKDIAPVLGRLRLIKSALEIEVMSQAGSIAGAMMQAAHESLAEGVPEYESALAVINAGTKKDSQIGDMKG